MDGEHLDAVRRLVRSPGGSRPDAHDVTTDVLVRACSWDRYDPHRWRTTGAVRLKHALETG